MNDIERKLAKLSTEKRRLLELKLKKKGSAGNAFPLSYAQQRLWFLHQLEPESTAYHIPAAVRLRGQLNREALEKSLQEIVRRHEILRTTFATINGTPMQIISQEGNFKLRSTDISNLPLPERENRLREILEAEDSKPFDLTKGPLLRVRLIKLDKAEHVLHILMHHIISDGWSVGVFVNEFGLLYESFLKGQPSPLPPLRIQYADFAVWQKRKLESELKEKQLAYWKKKLGGQLPVLELPTDHPRPVIKTYRGSHRKASITGPSVEKIRQLAKEHNTTLFMTLLAGFYALLYRYSNQDDICVGTPIANRNRAETEELIGFFVNTLVLRNDLSGEPSFKELLDRTRDISLEAFSHQDLPFEMLVEELQPERDMSHTPLFQVMFVYQNATEGGLKLPGLEVEPVPLGNENAKFDLTLTVSELPHELALSVEYDTDLFEASTIDHMLAHFNKLLLAMVRQPEIPVTRLDLLTDREKNLLLSEWVPQEVYFPPEKCVHQLFEVQAEKFADRTAITFEEQQITYGELNLKANQLAHYLLKQGVQPDDLVGIYFERNPYLLIAILGVLKAGAAYLPIDPVYPPERVAFMLEDAEVEIILTQSDLQNNLQSKAQKAICLDKHWPEIGQEVTTNPQTAVKPHHLIYVIYTSGSTGKPKGVLITHYNVVRLFQATDHWYHFNENDVWTLFHSYAFDFSVWEIWGALLYGGRLVVVPQLVSRSPETFYQLLIDEKVTVLNQTPSAFRQLIHAEELIGKPPYHTELRYIIFGGEALELNSLLPWFEKHGDRQPQLINMYGITETTVHVTYRPITLKDINAGKGSVIGRPIPDLQVYILDRHLQPVPIGVPGEIHVSGAGLGRGYLKRPELTSTKFVPNPFSKDSNAILYRSGDLGRYLENGDIEYLGRIDNQIKIRGFRIELGEIETLLAKHPAVRECVAMTAKDSRGDNIIAAYLVAKDGNEITSYQLREYLREKLPEYMVPSAFVLLDQFPLTPNGKIDRKALPDPSTHRLDLQREYIAPKTPTEEILAHIYSEILNVSKVGSNDQFFELGGHSLLATQLTSRIRDSFGVELPLKVLFEHPVINELARAIDQLKRKHESIEELPIKPIDRSGELPLSFAQKRLWFLYQMQPDDASYNIPSAFRVQGKLELDILHRVIDEIARRHETLRAVFKTIDGKPHVEILQQSLIKIEHIVLPPHRTDQKSIERRIINEARTPFNLEKGPLTRIKVLQLADDEFIIILNMHHIISDGWSMGILMREVAELYRAFSNGHPSPLAELEIQYVDFAAWQQKWLSGEVLEEQLDYWKNKLGHGSPPLQLPTDHPRPNSQTANGAHFYFKLSRELSERLAQFSQEKDVTLFMSLLSAFMILLHKYSGQEDISVGTPIANRNRSEIENIIGFFVNTLVMRADLSGDPTVLNFLKQTRETALGAYAHQDLPFEKLVDAIHPERDISHTPLFQVMFMLQNLPIGKQEVSDITIESLQVENGLSQFELTLSLTETGDGLVGSLEYNSDLFKQETIRRLAKHFQRLIQEMIDCPDKHLSEISLVSEKEIQILTKEWNQTQRTIPDMAIHHLIEVQAKTQPERIAIISGGEQMTYGELNEKATNLAAYLHSQGIGQEDHVGISLLRSPDLIVALLGILKCGAAYVPLDANYPKERLEFMINDSGISLLVTQRDLKDKIPVKDIPMLVLDESIQWQQGAGFASVEISGDQAAYVIYTSGSTGVPKGVVVSHRSVVNHNVAMAELFELHDRDRVLQFATINFDAAGEEIYPALQNGATLILRGNEVLISGEQLWDLVEDYGITILDLPTAYWHQLTAELKQVNRQIPPSLRLLVLGGDKLSSERYKDWLKAGGNKIRTLNTYGPTETTIVSIIFECPNSIEETEQLGEIPIGKPIANTTVYVLDKNLNPVPIGIPGELCIGGVGLARGYLNRHDLTAEKFISNPFSTNPGERIYRTGDLVRFLPDGNIEFIGRVDHQVKIRGFRVELGEIEHTILENPQIKDAAVVVQEKEPSIKRLVAYLVFRENSVADVATIREELKSKLPEYMVPTAFIKMDALPYLPSGKIDRRALPEPSEVLAKNQTQYVAPSNEKEKILAKIWQQVLGIEKIGTEDNFFELGGDSILSIQVIARARQAGIQIDPKHIFEYQTIRGLASVAENGGGIQAEQGIVTGEVPLTPIQKWFFEQNFDEMHHWNQSVLLQVDQAVDEGILREALQEIMVHHDALRLRFHCQDGQWRQFIVEPGDVPLHVYDFSGHTTEKFRLSIEETCAHLQGTLNLEHGPMMLMALFKTGEGRPDRIFIVIHHLAVDGVSWRILLEDLQNAYLSKARGQKISLPLKTTSFKSWAEKLYQYAQSPILEQEIAYWHKIALAEHSVPIDFPENRHLNIEQFKNTCTVNLEHEDTQALLKEVPAVYHTQISDVLLAALSLAFFEWSGHKTLLIDLEGHGRENIFENVDLSRTIGWFTSVYPVMLKLHHPFSPGEALIDTKEQLRQIPNQGIGFGLLRYLNKNSEIQKKLSSLPRAELCFNYLGQFDQLEGEDNVFMPASERVGPDHGLKANRNYLIEIDSRIAGGQLFVSWTFSAKLHTVSTIQQLASIYLEKIKAIIQYCKNPEAGGYTPSDFALANLNKKKLNKILENLNNS